MRRSRHLHSLPLAVAIACSSYGSEEEQPSPPTEDAGVDVTTDTTTNGLPDVVESDSGASDAGIDSADAGDATPARKRVFVTSMLFTGALGGINGGDQKCTAAALVVGLGGVWRAYLAEADGGTPHSRITPGQRELLDGGGVVFVVGPPSEAPMLPISIDEKGINLGNSSDKWVWTGVAPSVAPENRTCDGWTQGSPKFGGYGNITSTANWQNFGGTTAGCASTYRLYCFEE